MARKKGKGTELSVFKGREAKLNRAIFRVLANKEPASTREVYKRITQIRGMKHTTYSTVNKRVRNLEQSGYLKKVTIDEKVGGITNYYELRPKACLACFINSIEFEDILAQVNDITALVLLSTLFSVIEPLS